MRRLRDESGITIVEALVAGLLLVIGALGLLQVFDAAARNNFRAEESQVVVNRLQAELEELRAIPFEELAMTANPGHVTDQNDPRWRVSGSSFAMGKNGTNFRPMVIDATAGFTPGPEPFTVGDVSGEIWMFVVWAPDPDCPDVNGCEDLKRLIVAARIDEAPVSFEHRYQDVQGDVANPEALPPENPNPSPAEDPVFAAELWPTDTPCTVGTRQPIVADHPAHNTRARCSDGATTGLTPGAPDLMFTDTLDSVVQPTYDYATDSEPATGGSSDEGLLMPTTSLDSCVLEPALGLANVRAAALGELDPLPSPPANLAGLLDLVSSEENKHLRAHTWVSPKVSGSGGELTGEGTLQLWTKTINGASYPGQICVSVFIRQTVQVPVQPPEGSLTYVDLQVDVPVVNVGNLNGGEDLLDPGLTHFRYQRDPWPQAWQEIEMPLEFVTVNTDGAPVPIVLEPGDQVGMTLTVRDAGTQPGTGLEFNYDHPSFDSRLQLQSDAVIPFEGGI